MFFLSLIAQRELSLAVGGMSINTQVGFYLGFAEYMLDLSGDDVIGTPPSQPDTEAKAKRYSRNYIQSNIGNSV